MMISQNFDVRELVHPDIFNHPAVGFRCADFLNIHAAPTLEELKHNLQGDIITVNDWHIGGSFINSGLRSAKLPYGGRLSYSAHYFGCGFDVKARSFTAAEVWSHILSNQEKYPYITRMENHEATPTWTHIEVGNERRLGDIVIFNP